MDLVQYFGNRDPATESVSSDKDIETDLLPSVQCNWKFIETIQRWKTDIFKVSRELVWWKNLAGTFGVEESPDIVPYILYICPVDPTVQKVLTLVAYPRLTYEAETKGV